MQVEIIGLQNIEPLATFSGRFDSVVGPVVQKSAELLRDDTKRLPPVSAATSGYEAKGIPVAPKHGGFMRQNIEKAALAQLAAGVGTGRASYGPYVHDGTRKMPARPFFEFALEMGTEKEIDQMIDEAALSLLDGE